MVQKAKEPKGQRFARRLAMTCSGLAALLGMFGLISWAADLPILRGADVAAFQMKPNTAVGFLLGAIALFCALGGKSSRLRRLGSFCAWTMLILGAVSLAESAFSWDLGIDELIAKDIPSRLAGRRPGLMVPASGINFMLKGIALLLIDWRTRRGQYPFQWISLASAVAPLVALIAFSNGISDLLTAGAAPYLLQMSPNTAIAWLALTTGTLCARPRIGFMDLVFSDTPSAPSFRRALGFTLLIPILLSSLADRVEQWRVYYPGFGSAALTLFVTLFLFRTIWRTYAGLLRSEAQLAEAIEQRDEFASIASHELKTPLAAMRMKLQMIGRSLPETQRSRMDSALQQVDRFALLIDDMLDLSRIRMGKLAFHFEPVDLAELAREVSSRFSGQLAEAGCELRLHIQTSVSGEWDRARVEQVVANLLSNAIKYAPGGAIDLEVRADGPVAMIAVSDSGPGISADQQSKIFERFERGKDSASIDGLGLGLYVCRKILEAHGGNIRVESEPGKGSKFVVELPMSSANPGLKRSTSSLELAARDQA